MVALLGLVGVALVAGLLGQQRLPVGDGDLVIVGMDLAEGEEAVPVAAVVDEGSLQGGFYPDDFRQVDVAAKLFLVGRLEIEFLDAVTANDDDAGFLRVGGIDQHFVGHERLS